MRAVAEIIAHLRSLNITLFIDDGHLGYHAPEGALTPELRSKLIANRDEILELLRKTESFSHSIASPILPVPRNAELPLSFSQQRLWFLDQLIPNSPVYNINYSIRLKGKLNAEALERALCDIVRRHEVLRTNFTDVGGRPVQVISTNASLKLPIIDLQEIPESDRKSEAMRLVNLAAMRPFNLSRDLLIRASLMRLTEMDHVFLLTMHHIVSDAWSMGILRKELSVLYEAFATERPSPLPEPTLHYADFAVWQRKQLQGEVLESRLSYWIEHLAGAPPAIELPTDRRRPSVTRYRGRRIRLAYPSTLAKKVADLGQREGCTLFMTLLSSLSVLLHRYTGQDDIVIGSPIANRSVTEVEDMIGFFANTLAMRTNLSGNPTFREYLHRVREVCLSAYEHQDMPFEKLVEELQPERNLSHNPLFQVLFAFHNVPHIEFKLHGLDSIGLDHENNTTKFDLIIRLSETGRGLSGHLTYSADLFDESTITRMAKHFGTLLESIVENPDQRISDLKLMTEAERYQMLVEWNDTQVDYDRDQLLHQIIEKQAERMPDAVAVEFEGQQLTYSQLNSRANQLARYLRKFGISPEAMVGICLERSLEMLIGVLGIMKSGGAYMPLDPTYPKKRLEFMIEETKVPIILTQDKLVDVFQEYKSRKICMDSDWRNIAKESEDNPVNKTHPEDLAYVLYTSGSTGKPKGVQIEHHSLLNFLNSMRRQLEVSRDDILLAVTTLSFDISALELYLPLMVGARVVIVSRAVAVDGEELSRQLATSGATAMQATPATWRLLLESGWRSGKEFKILCGGEALPRELANQLKEDGATLWNLYGPTETTVYSAVARVEDNEGPVTIGKPIANTQIYILDAHLHPVPTGVFGELYIGGEGLSRGYLNRPDLTTESFVDNPFSDESSSRLYKTGDLARYLPDGNIDFLGRIDHQVKLRGYRIELGEIEAVLGQHPGVQEVVVIVREDSPNDKRLVAYIVPEQNETPQINELRSLTAGKLPDYMIPSAFVFLDALPLTPNGKINRRALLPPDWSDQRGTFTAPRTLTEKKIAEIWAKVLQIERVGVYDNFFELGGHSLLAIQVISQIRSTFQIELPLRILFTAPRVSDLADQVENLSWIIESLMKSGLGDSEEGREEGRL